ncbi:MAG: hypothetical protein WC549_04660 [Actinomycetota bacterium]
MTWTPDQQKSAEKFWKKEPIKRDGIDFELLARAGIVGGVRVRKNWNMFWGLFWVILTLSLIDAFWIFRDYWWSWFFLSGYFFLGYFIGSYFDKKV